MNNEEYEVAGYIFENEKQADRARRELSGIEHINEQLKNKKPSEMIEIYNSVIDKKIFRTPIGYEYLKGVQRKLKSIPSVKKEDVKPITVISNTANENKKTQNDDGFTKKALIFINVVLVAVIIIMFIISASGKTKFNEKKYIEQIENRYSSWEKELNERESILNKKENQ
ncbi:MAG: hypothetical protein K2I03_11710 [Lachnospiraceae bacterium]|nr:hypothetical protein [Lachnospiraceae bacterium]MDE6253930.1 hypothetical protein [Lachnospiraceae bacterium]